MNHVSVSPTDGNGNAVNLIKGSFFFFLNLFAQDLFLLQYFIHHCSIIIEQEVSEAFLGLCRRPPLLTLNKKLGDA